MEVEVEVLDVTDEEARVLLLSIDPLAEMAQMQAQLYERLCELTPTEEPELRRAWEAAARESVEAQQGPRKLIRQDIPEQYLVLITCRDEKHQVELLGRFQAEGLLCKALLS